MAKLLLKISIILMLLLSAAALVMAYFLFEQREILKGRTQKLENTIIQVASSIETGDETGATITLPTDILRDFERMDTPLNHLQVAARYQLERLNITRQDLADTKDTLAKTEKELEITVANLEDMTRKHDQAVETIAQRDQSIRENRVVIDNLEREKDEMETKVASLESEVATLQVRNRDLTDQLAAQTGRLKDLEATAGPPRVTDKMIKGRQGIILHVDPKWNFVVFDIAPDSQELIVPDLELIVHRDDEFIGKVRVASIDANLAVADIMSDWQQSPLEKNDEVIY